MGASPILKMYTQLNTTQHTIMHANTRSEDDVWSSVANMPRADITPMRLHDVAIRATEAARQKVTAIIGRECDEDILCAFIDPLQPIRAKDVAEFKWTSGSLEVLTHLRVDKALYCNCVGPPRTFMTSLVATSALKALRQQIPAWMQEDGAAEIVVDAIAAPRAIDKLPAREMFKVGNAQAEHFRCARIEGDRWLCTPAARPFHPSRMVDVDVVIQKVELPKKRRQEGVPGKDDKQLEFEHLIACAVWQAEQLRAAEQGRPMHADDAESGLLKDPADWPAGRAQFTVVLWRSHSGGEWQHHLTPARLLDLIKERKHMSSS